MGLADFEYVSSASLISALTGATRGAAPDVELGKHGMSIPPVAFSANDMPSDFLPRRQSLADAWNPIAGAGRLGGAAKAALPKVRRQRHGQPMHFGTPVEFAGGKTPDAPPEAVRLTINQEDTLFVLMKARFAQRPVWSRQVCVCGEGVEIRPLIPTLIPTRFLTRFLTRILTLFLTAFLTAFLTTFLTTFPTRILTLA
jgi:hypothetical protein|tara:strand:+ start:91 stop:687 length:597 start_codon:yes stop_codon:yes gene_type:complete